MVQSFRNVRLCSVGNLEDGAKIPQWVQAHGGTYLRKVDNSTTHLIATKEAYENDVDAVKAAKDLGKIKIVSLSWLKHSLWTKTRRPLPETPYLFKSAEQGAQRTTTKAGSPSRPKRNIRDPFPKNKRKVTKRSIGPSREEAGEGRVYKDSNTQEVWKALLTRICNPPRSREKYQLAIIQSSARSPTYGAYVKYSRVGKSTVELLAPAHKSVGFAMSAFAKFFKEKTGKEWCDRADGKLPPPKTNDENQPLPPHEGWFSLESHSNLFTDYLKSVPEQADTNESGGSCGGSNASFDRPVDAVAKEDSTGADDQSEMLAKNRALLQTLLAEGSDYPIFNNRTAETRGENGKEN
ncbi:hypothetical protein N7532_011506 [Penicillium argentinense]|uniref:BRCT domain-containing protein n=1 Tax=Penicillium argentinense TaxID=1131581 RepID=A0A9W9EII5_9EURO|nr:uncharacterized protein N7532_011506 [Penicillium argentinense]KAJ5082463.1 hypothetical protein N7532_011506 [Penicillium argentinense]